MQCATLLPFLILLEYVFIYTELVARFVKWVCRITVRLVPCRKYGTEICGFKCFVNVIKSIMSYTCLILVQIQLRNLIRGISLKEVNIKRSVDYAKQKCTRE
jgi:hypothetical protein